MNYTTAEIRWFYKGAVPEHINKWYLPVKSNPEQKPERTDLYLLNNSDNLGIKIREGRIELKQQLKRYPSVQFGPTIGGQPGLWRKWVFNLTKQNIFSEMDKEKEWLPVAKKRQLARFEITEQNTILPVSTSKLCDNGCEVELSAIFVKGQQWWSICFEAFGDAPNVHQTLLLMCDHFFKATKAPELKAGYAYGYPVFLKSL